MANPEGEYRQFPIDTQRRLDHVARLHRKPGRVYAHPNSLFPLLLGPSAIGKSTIIAALNELSGDRFVYISPYMTRELRPGEQDKKSVSTVEFEVRQAAGEFVFVNRMYGVSYGTPLAPIQDALMSGRMPILDFPLEKVPLLKRPEYDTVGIYLFPPTVGTWLDRIALSERNINGRLQAGLEELDALMHANTPHPNIDISVINDDVTRAAGEILGFLEGIQRPRLPASAQLFP